MSKLSTKLTARFVALLVIGALSLLVVAGAGAWGLGQTRTAADKLYNDQLQTVDETSFVGQELDDAYEQAQAILLTNDPGVRQQLTDELLQSDAPEVEVALATLQRIHAGDPQNQLALVSQLVTGWAQFRTLWTTHSLLASPPNQPVVAAQLGSVFDPLEGVTDKLVAIEQREATADHQRGNDAYRTSLILIGAVAAAELLVSLLFVVFVARRVLPRALAPEEAQADFAEAMQLAGGRSQVQRLLMRHLERAIPDSTTVVFNTDAESGRLESLMPLESTLLPHEAVREAPGASCTAIRSERPYTSQAGREHLMPCDIC